MGTLTQADTYTNHQIEKKILNKEKKEKEKKEKEEKVQGETKTEPIKFTFGTTNTTTATSTQPFTFTFGTTPSTTTSSIPSTSTTTSTPSTSSTPPVNELVNFIAAESFQGAKPGYQFQLGNSGLGYYLTSVSLTTTPQIAAIHEVLVSEDGIMLERNHVLSSTLSFPVDYISALDLIIHGKKDKWSSIVRFTSTSQNEGTYGDRLLGLFLPPSSTKLCISTDTTTQNNHHHYTGALTVGKKLHIVITVKGKTKTVSVNGTEHISISDLQERTHHTKNVTVYASGTHYVEASATIQNVHFSTAGTTSLLAESNIKIEPIVEGAKLRLERSLQFKMNRTQLPATFLRSTSTL